MTDSAQDFPRADAALRWQPPRRSRRKPDPELRDWLLGGGSLTARLQRLSGGAFTVQVLEEGWERGNPLSLASCFPRGALSRNMWSRRVMLLGCGEPWVVAHTLIPVSSLRGSLRRLRALNSTPLGAFLFRQRQIHRGGIEIAWSEGGIPGRRSLFYRELRPLVVAEFFLPALESRIRARKSSESTGDRL